MQSYIYFEGGKRVRMVVGNIFQTFYLRNEKVQTKGNKEEKKK